MDQFWTSVVTVITAIIGVAILAILVSKQAQTANVITAGAKGFSSLLGTAISPVTGGSGIGGLGNVNFTIQ